MQNETLTPRQTVQLAGSGLVLIAVSYGVARFAYGLFVPEFRAEFDIGPSKVGVIGSASYTAYCLAIYPAMMLTPRWGSRVVSVLAGVLATLGIGMIAMAPNVTVFAAGVVVAGLSTGVVSPPLAHAVAVRVPHARRDRLQAVINSGTGLGIAFSGPVALLTLQHWRGAWILFTLAAALATLWVARSVPVARQGEGHLPDLEGAGEVTRSSASAVRSLLPAPLFPAGSLRLAGAAVSMGVSTSAVWVFGRDVLSGAGGQSELAATSAWVLLGVFGLTGALVGDAARHFGTARVWCLTAAGSAAATAAVGIMPWVTVLSFCATALFGACYIAMTGLLLISGARIYQKQPAAGVGLAFLTLALGQAVGGAALGGMISSFGPAVAFSGAAGAAVVSALCAPSYSPGPQEVQSPPSAKPASSSVSE